ncbi:hypothetical protein GETHLI_26120 [Geothrix limicola]|uniref:DUF304 domain-containing protein n=1 Tax=Geothrix limicola TaxID=2927978 RepID=A0ABQ5QGW8_9BACT|nr:hypothetical protein [Geothrix limicola]GLH74110.1 hypothetical protein GETHLI_26120 [Geothrix limicola]
MSVGSPLVFRPSFAQRAMAMLLFAGSWLVGVRALAQILERLPVLRASLRVAEAAGDPTWSFWVAVVAAFGAVLMGSLLLLGTLLGVLLVEGSHVLVDDLGLSVEHNALPASLARRLGAGRLLWKQISRIERSGPFFVLRGGGDPGATLRKDPNLRFLLVDELERLVLTILERSPNLKHED